MNINRILENMTLATKRAAELNCTIVAVLNNVILCHRKGDDTYITWKCYIQRVTIKREKFITGIHTTTAFKALFDAGAYDMDLKTGQNSLISRSNWCRMS